MATVQGKSKLLSLRSSARAELAGKGAGMRRKRPGAPAPADFQQSLLHVLTTKAANEQLFDIAAHCLTLYDHPVVKRTRLLGYFSRLKECAEDIARMISSDPTVVGECNDVDHGPYGNLKYVLEEERPSEVFIDLDDDKVKNAYERFGISLLDQLTDYWIEQSSRQGWHVLSHLDGSGDYHGSPTG